MSNTENLKDSKMINFWSNQANSFMFNDVDVDMNISIDQFKDNNLDSQKNKWIQRAIDEHKSTQVFIGILLGLFNTNAPMEVIATCNKMIRDEMRHTQLCLKILKVLGVEENQIPFKQVTIDNSDNQGILSVAREILVSIAIGETLSVEIIKFEVELFKSEKLKTIGNIFLEDEKFHSEFGVNWLKENWIRFDRETKLYLTLECKKAIKNIAMSPLSKHPLYFSTMENKIFPTLEAIGFDINFINN